MTNIDVLRLDPVGSPEDFERMMRCIGQLYRELFGETAVPDDPLRRRIGRQLGSAPPHWAFVVTQHGGGDDVAFFTLAEAFAVFAHGAYGILNELWVRPDERGRGIGDAILEWCRAFGRDRGWERIDVSAPPDPRWDRTFEFYRAHGFEFTGRKLKTFL